MRIAVILGHPYRRSFNHAIAEVTLDALRRNSHEVFYHDLYGEEFDPLITGRELTGCTSGNALVEQHCFEIAQAEGVIIIHPNWWGQPPAILKGWVDRVLRPQIAYGFAEGDSGGGIPQGLLKAKKSIVFNTSNTPEEREVEVFGDPLETIWRNCIFDFCGVKAFERKMFRVVADSTLEQRQGWLAEVREIVSAGFPPK